MWNKNFATTLQGKSSLNMFNLQLVQCSRARRIFNSDFYSESEFLESLNFIPRSHLFSILR